MRNRRSSAPIPAWVRAERARVRNLVLTVVAISCGLTVTLAQVLVALFSLKLGS